MEVEMPLIGLLEEPEVLVKEALQLFEMELIIFMDMMMIKFIELSWLAHQAKLQKQLQLQLKQIANKRQ